MIKKLHVRNFKSLRDLTVSLGLRNLFVGPNMSGKSNVIDVFRFLAQMLSPAPGTYGLPNAVLSMGGFPEIVWKGGESNLISISLEGDTSQDADSEKPTTWKYAISILGDERGYIKVQEEVLTVSRPDGNHHLIDTSEGQRVFKNADGRTISQVSHSDRSALEFEIPDWDGNKFRELVRSWQFFRLIPTRMKQANPTSATNFLTEHGDNLSSWLMNLQTRYPQSFAKIRSVMKDVFPELEDLFTWPTQQTTVYVISMEKHLKRPLSVWQMSDGELAFLALLSLIFNPLGGRLFCVEEPENHLHPRLLETLVELLKQVQDELPAESRAQIMMTTHSPYLVDKFSLDELIIVEKHDGATVCQRATDKAQLRKLLEREEIGLGDLFYSGALGGS